MDDQVFRAWLKRVLNRPPKIAVVRRIDPKQVEIRPWNLDDLIREHGLPIVGDGTIHGTWDESPIVKPETAFDLARDEKPSTIFGYPVVNNPALDSASFSDVVFGLPDFTFGADVQGGFLVPPDMLDDPWYGILPRLDPLRIAHADAARRFHRSYWPARAGRRWPDRPWMAGRLRNWRRSRGD